MRLANLSAPATQAELREEAWDENCVSSNTHSTDSLEVF